MSGYAEDTEITFNGTKGKVEMARLSMVGQGPHSTAVDLAGTDFYWWMVEYPDECHRFLAKITKGLAAIEEYSRKIDTRERRGFGLAEDSSQIMSDEMFRQFTVPYAKYFFDRYGADGPDGRGMHMCGSSSHLQRTLVDELKITNFNGFGYLVPPETAARNMGGKVLLWGNIDPMLIKNGTKREVEDACMDAMEVLAPYGGFMLGDGANICPSTPLENLAVFSETSGRFSAKHPELFERR
jgi:uroporphyrinogen decarboxylase